MSRRLLTGLLVLLAAAGVGGGLAWAKQASTAAVTAPAAATEPPVSAPSPAATAAPDPTPGTAPTPTTAPTTGPDAAGAVDPLRVSLVDDSGHVTLEADLDPSSKYYGSFRFLEPGVGIVWPRRSAAVDSSSSGVVTASYDGPGYLNRRARIDPEYATVSIPRGPIRQAHVRLEARLRPSRRTGVLDLWVNARHLHVTFGQPPADAAPVVRAVVRALRAEDFAALYGVADSGLRNGLSRAAFVAQGKRQGAGFTVAAVRRTGPVSYRTTSTGVHYAYAPIAAVISHDGVRQHVRQQIVLIREDGRWRFTTTRSGRRP